MERMPLSSGWSSSGRARSARAAGRAPRARCRRPRADRACQDRHGRQARGPVRRGSGPRGPPPTEYPMRPICDVGHSTSSRRKKAVRGGRRNSGVAGSGSCPSMLNGPRIPPASGGKPRSLVVFVHGYGADGNDLIGIGANGRRPCPTRFRLPARAEPCAGAPMGRQWFPLTMRDPQEFARGVGRPAPALDVFLDAELPATASTKAPARWSASARAP